MTLWKQIVAFVLITALFCTMSGCPLIKTDSTEPVEETKWVSYTNTYNGYKDHEIGAYERLRAKDLLEDCGFTDYSMEGSKRHYNYSAEDFRSVEELDETYLYALYVICDEETFETVLVALGYENLADFLTRMNYVDDEGNPSLLVWSITDMELISGIMVMESKD